MIILWISTLILCVGISMLCFGKSYDRDGIAGSGLIIIFLSIVLGFGFFGNIFVVETVTNTIIPDEIFKSDDAVVLYKDDKVLISHDIRLIKAERLIIKEECNKNSYGNINTSKLTIAIDDEDVGTVGINEHEQ